MSKTLNIVYGCSVFGVRPKGTKPEDICITQPEIPSNCPYCYAKCKFSDKEMMPKDFSKPIYYRDKLLEIQNIKTPEIFTGSIMGDFLSPYITNDQLVDMFSLMEECPQHLFLMLSKNTPRYVDFTKNVWKRDLPKNIWVGTSIENHHYKKRADFLRELKELSPKTKVWIESEPTIGYHTKTDFTDIDYVSISHLGEDQIYTSQQGKKFSSYFEEGWILSIFHNPTLDSSKISIWDGTRKKCKSPEIIHHKNYNMYEELHILNGRLQKNKEKDDFSSLW